MSVEEETQAGGAPEWMVTFGDMMSLLLTFFIMLISLSEVKQEEKFQAMMESLHKQFGYDSTSVSAVPGIYRPRNSRLAKMASMGRAKRSNLMKGGDKVKAPVGDYPRVRIIRPGSRTAVGTVVFFDEGSAEVAEKYKNDLQAEIGEIGGKPQKIEIRGHTSQRPVPKNSPYHDNWGLAYQRCRNVMQFLVGSGIERRRIRMSVAGPYEPLYLGTDPAQMKQNPRVEVYLLDETVDDLEGSPDQRDGNYVDQKTTVGPEN